MWEKILASLKEMFGTQQAAIKADVAEAVKSAMSATEQAKELTEKLSAASTENTTLKSSLAEANAKLETLGTGSTAVLSALTEAGTALKIENFAALDPVAQVKALQTKVSDTLAQLGTAPTDIPAGGQKSSATAPKTFTERCLAANGKK